MKISVSVLKEKDNLNDTIKKLDKTSCDFIHLDVMDSTFTANSSFSLKKLKSITTKKKYDIHIMSNNLNYQINEAIRLKPQYITFHIETKKDILKYISLIKDNKIKVGLAINPKTRLSKLKKYLSYVDMVLVMGVNAGESGQKYIEKTTKKLIKLNKMKKNFLISVDGGINNETISIVKDYVDIVVVGSYITDSNNYDKTIKELKKYMD